MERDETISLEAVKRTYDEFALQYLEEMKLPYQIFYRERIKRVLDKRIKKGSRILDIGCGTGFPSHYLAERGCYIIAIDISEAMIRIASQSLDPEYRNNISFCVLNAENLHHFPDNYFDVITAIYGPLCYVNDVGIVLKHIKRICKESGLFMASFYSKYSLPRMMSDSGLIEKAGNKSGRVVWKEHISDNITQRELLTFLYEADNITQLFKNDFEVIDIQGLGFIPFLFSIEKSPELLNNLKRYVELEERLANRQPFMSLGMDILTIAKPLK